jgi:uncharacterized protein (TIGR03066 family)
MRFYRLALVALLCPMILATVGARAADIDKARLIGSWEMILPADAKIDLKLVITFANDGKATVTVDGMSKKETKEATWKLDGDKLTFTPKDGKEKPEAITVKSITAEKLTLSDKSGKDVEFKKTTPPKPLAFAPETPVAAREVKDESVAEIDARKIIGKWAVPGEKAQIEFARDGKLTMTAEGVKVEGKYKLEKNKLTVMMDFGGKEQTEVMTVTSLSDDKLVTVDSKGKKEELTRTK